MASQNIDKPSRALALYPEKTLLVNILQIKNTDKTACFSSMLIYSLHNLNVCSDSQERRFLWNILLGLYPDKTLPLVY